MKLLVVGSVLLATLANAHEEMEHMDMSMGTSTEISHEPAAAAIAAAAPAAAVNGSSHNGTMAMKPSPASMKGGHSHGMPILEMLDMLEPQQKAYWLAYDPTTYFSAKSGNKALLYLHALLQVVALGLLHPATALLSGTPATQWLYLPLQTLVLLMTVGSALVASAYSLSLDEELYPGNCYAKVAVIFIAVLAVQWVAAVSKCITQGATALDGVEYHMANFERPSQDSGNGLSEEDFDIEEPEESQPQPRGPPRFADKLAHSRFAGVFAAFQGISSALFAALTIPAVLFGYAYLLIGTFIAFRMGQGHTVFALLAHAIKGSVFILLGFVEFSRYFGAFANKGMAWNRVEIYSKESPSHGWVRSIFPRYPTMEFIQSFLIFFYGSTNVFLERLGNTDGKWNAKDMQHVSIAFMFFGGGLCGMLVESERISELVARAFGYEHERKTARTWSVNPFPLLIIFWTGALMSQHAQETELATAIHAQWGLLLSAAACLRAATYALLYVRGAGSSSEVPQRPFTELLCAFCLVSGGMIFVLSNRETVEGMIYDGITSMFSLIVGVGITSLLLVYAALALAFKGWATR